MVDDEFSFKSKNQKKKHKVDHKEQQKEHKQEEKSSRSHRSEKSDEFSFSSFKFLTNKKVLTVLSIIFLLVIAFGTSWYFRTRTLDLPVTRDWAENNVAQYYKQQIRSQVDKQYPNLPVASKNPIVESEYVKFYATNKAAIEANVNDAQKFFLSNLQDDHGLTYILNIDSFYFFRRAELIVNTGHYYDTLVDGKQYDTYMLAPRGLETSSDFHSYFAAILYKIMHFFSANASLALAAFYTPVILASLCVIPLFFIVRKYAGNFAGFFAALILAIHPVFLGRTMGGDFDNDVYNILFPLLVSWIFIEILEARNLKNKLILTFVNGFMIGVFAFAWRGGWWYIFDFFLAVLFLFLWYRTIKKIIDHAFEKRWLSVSKAWTKILLFFGPPVLILLTFLIYRPTGFVFFCIYVLAILYFFIKQFAGVLAAWKKKNLTKEQENILSVVLILVLFTIISAIFVSWFIGAQTFIRGPLSPIRITTLQEAAKADYWPNVYTTVAELNVTDFAGIIGQIASFGSFGAKINVFFIIAAMGVILTLVKKKIDWRDVTLLIFSLSLYLILMTPSALTLPPVTYLALFSLPLVLGLYFLLDVEGHDIMLAAFLVIWFVATLYAGTKGIRFIHLMLPAFTVGLGVAIGKLYAVLSNLATKELSINKYIAKGVLAILLLLILIAPLQGAVQVAKGSVPIFDRTWYESMDAIKKDSQPNAIINSWWDFGHYFKAVANRSVTFDGAIQNTPPAHWVGLVLSTDDQDDAVGILRMLDCSQNEAYEVLNKNVGVIRAIAILDRIVPVDAKSAQKILEEEKLSDVVIQEVLAKTHCSPPEDYFITSGDMVGKAGVWAHFGYWDITRSYIYVNIRGKSRDKALSFLKDNLSITGDEADRYITEVAALTTDRMANSWVSAWPGYVTTNTLGCMRVNNTEECRINLGIGQNPQSTTVIERAIINLDDLNASTLQFGVYDKSLASKLGGSIEKPHAFVISGPNGFTTVTFKDAVFPYDVVVDTYNHRMIIADPLLSKSTFTKLFYFDGMYMDHFDKIFDKTGIGGVNVKVWKVDWDGKTGKELELRKEQWGIVKPKELLPEPNVTSETVNELVNATGALNASE
jgi:asparagine N-glycosylation enzyme membrane subunit Stt3